MKFLLVPLLIIGMFASFIASLLAMLFFTGIIQTPQELEQLVMGKGTDSTRVVEEFADREDELEKLFETANQYNSSFEAELKRLRELQDSLVAEQMKISVISDSLAQLQQVLGQGADSTLNRKQGENLKSMATFFNKIKPADAAEILQQGELGDTTTARLMKQLQPAHMAKIMGQMAPDFAARIAKLMQEL